MKKILPVLKKIDKEQEFFIYPFLSRLQEKDEYRTLDFIGNYGICRDSVRVRQLLYNIFKSIEGTDAYKDIEKFMPLLETDSHTLPINSDYRNRL